MADKEYADSSLYTEMAQVMPDLALKKKYDEINNKIKELDIKNDRLEELIKVFLKKEKVSELYGI